MSVQFFTSYAEYARYQRAKAPRVTRPRDIAATLAAQKPVRDILRIATPRDDIEAAIALADRIAREHGSSLEELRGRRRGEPTRKIRRACIRETAKACPKISWTELGRVFDRDRTTIMHAVGARNR